MLECYFVRMLFVSHVIRLLNTKVRFGRLCLPHANIVGQSEGSGSILIFDQFKGRILSNLVHMPKYGHVLVFGPLLSHFCPIWMEFWICVQETTSYNWSPDVIM